MLTNEKLETVLQRLGEVCTKPMEITVCGGASMVLNYNTRQSTQDVDCFRLENALKDSAVVIAKDVDLPIDWLNDNVCVTSSYNEKLMDYRKHYKTYGKLKVYTIKGLPLLCMKLVSFREYSSDAEDCRNLIRILKGEYTAQDVRDTIYEIYHDMSIMSVDAELFLAKEFDGNSFVLDEEALSSYCGMVTDGLISIDEIPQEFKLQVEKRLTKSSTTNSNLDKSIDRLLSI